MRTRIEATASWLLPFALVVYLGVRGGGYDTIVRDGVGIAVWVLLGAGTLTGLLPRSPLSPLSKLALGCLAGLAVWSLIGMLWTESDARTFEAFTRLLTLLGLFGLGVLLQGRDGPGRTLGAVATAVVVIAGLAILSRLIPGPFPADQFSELQSPDRARLNYPLDSWNGLAAMLAFGLPIVFGFALWGRRVTRVLASSAIPLLVLALYLTYSRAGLVTGAIAAVGFLMLNRRNIEAFAVAGIAVVCSGLAIAAASQRPAVDLAAIDTPSQREEMLVIVLVLCVASGILRVAAELLAPRLSMPAPLAGMRLRRAALIGIGIAALGAGIALGAPERIADGWEEFKNPVREAATEEPFQSASGNGRYQYWTAAVDAGASAPITGIGAGSWDLWWTREATIDGFTRYAHSLYFETFAELGVVGVLLLLGLLASIGVAAVRAFRESGSAHVPLLAGALMSLIAFAIAASLDWLLQLTVIPAAFLFVAAAILNRPPAAGGAPGDAGPLAWKARIGAAAVAVAAVAVLAVSVAGASLLQDSEAALETDPQQALEDAEAAERVQPWSAEPVLAQASARSRAGDYEEAIELTEEAIEMEPTNWRPWYLKYGIEGNWALSLSPVGVDFGDPESLELFQSAQASYLRAQKLNPRAPFLLADVTQINYRTE